MSDLFKINEITVAILAIIACVGIGMRAIKYRDLYLVGDIIPRLYIAAIYIYFSIDPIYVEATIRGLYVRYGLTALLVTEIVKDLVKMWSVIKDKKDSE